MQEARSTYLGGALACEKICWEVVTTARAPGADFLGRVSELENHSQ